MRLLRQLTDLSALPGTGLLFAAVFFLVSRAEAQPKSSIVVTGVVEDALTKERLELVTVRVKGKAVGVLTNQEGKFSLQLPPDLASDSLTFSRLGYQPQTVPVKEWVLPGKSTMLLQPATLALKEVVVNAKNPQSILSEVSRRLKDNFPSSPYEFEGYYRNSYRELGTYVRQMEIAFTGYDRHFLRTGAFGVAGLKQQESQDYRRFKWRQKEGNIPWHHLWQVRRQHTHFFANQGKGSKYHYQVEDTTSDNGDAVYKIKFTLKDTAQRRTVAWAYVRAKDYAILEIGGNTEIAQPKMVQLSNELYFAYTGSSVLVKFVTHQGKMYPAYSSSQFNHEVYNQHAQKQGTFDLVEEMIIHEIKTQSKYKSKKPFLRDQQELVAELAKDSTFWQRYNKPVETALSRAIARDLAKQGEPPVSTVARPEGVNAYDAPHRLISAEDLRSDFALVKKALQEAHPALYRYAEETAFNRALDSTYRLLNHPLTPMDFYRMLTPLLARIRCGHTSSQLPESYYRYMNEKPGCLPLLVKYAEKKIRIAALHTANPQLRIGDEVLAINGRASSQVVNELYPHLAVDGYIASRKEQLIGSYFTELYNTYLEQPDQYMLHVRTMEGKQDTVRVPAIPGADYTAWRNQLSKAENTYRLLGPKTALLRVGTFTDGKNQPFKDWVTEAIADMGQQRVEDLVIDLRNNEGGRDDYALYLLSYLMKQPFRYHESVRAAANRFTFLSHTQQGESFNAVLAGVVQPDTAGKFTLSSTHPTLGLQQPKPDAFRGNLYFLINGNTFSAAADMAAIAKEHQLGVFIGQESGGAAVGNTSNGELTLNLPHSGIEVRIPLFEIKNAVSGFQPGRGVIPDFVTGDNPRYWADKQDPELLLALDLISK